MNKWWIIRIKGCNSLVIVPLDRPSDKSAIGPYFSYKEAMAMLHYWSK